MPSTLRYATAARHGSRYNTPPVFAIYLAGLILQWLRAEGGLDAVDARNRRKAGLLYDAIDRSGFYRGAADPASRSLMNVTFRLPDDELEQRFLQQAAAAGLAGLKGHRSVGGIRASIYNAFPEAGVGRPSSSSWRSSSGSTADSRKKKRRRGAESRRVAALVETRVHG